MGTGPPTPCPLCGNMVDRDKEGDVFIDEVDNGVCKKCYAQLESHFTSLDGFDISIHRSDLDGRIVLGMNTHDSDPADNDEDMCPVFRLCVNDGWVDSESIVFEG